MYQVFYAVIYMNTAHNKGELVKTFDNLKDATACAYEQRVGLGNRSYIVADGQLLEIFDYLMVKQYGLNVVPATPWVKPVDPNQAIYDQWGFTC